MDGMRLEKNEEGGDGGNNATRARGVTASKATAERKTTNEREYDIDTRRVQGESGCAGHRTARNQRRRE
jgi:hypothetical protein